jgi:hypothetical protein
MINMLKANWQDEELDIYYRKNGYPKSVWKDNEGMPYGIYYYSDDFADIQDVEWFATEQERDQSFKTIESNDLNNIKRVHSGTANEDTLEDLINDVVSFLENLTEQLKENEDESC